MVVEEPKPHDDINDKFQGLVGLEELAKTDRILVQQVFLFVTNTVSCDNHVS